MESDILPIDLRKFLNGIKYNPIHVMHDDYDDVYMAEFRTVGKMEANLELYGHLGDDGKQCVYFEIIDFNDYEEGTIIGKDRRHGVVHMRMGSEDDIKTAQNAINESLHNLYK